MDAAGLIFYIFLGFIPILSLVLLLFRFKLKPNLLPILAISFIIANVCYFLNAYEVDFLTAIAQPILIILGFWLIFKIRLLHTILMVFMVYLPNVFLEYSFNTILRIMEISLNTKDYFVFFGALLIIGNTSMCLVAAKFRLGFSFIPASSLLKPKLIGNAKYITYFFILCFLSIGMSGLTYLVTINMFTLIVHIIILLMLGMLLRFSFSQEELQ